MNTLFSLLIFKKLLNPRKVSRSYKKGSKPVVKYFKILTVLMFKLDKFLTKKLQRG